MIFSFEVLCMGWVVMGLLGSFILVFLALEVLLWCILAGYGYLGADRETAA